MVFRTRRGVRKRLARALYDAVVAQARRPDFYLSGGVPDSLDGRFEMIAIHAYLVMRRLRTEGAEGAALSQALFDIMFDDMDRNLREMGAGDLGVGRRVKLMARGFYGRIAAYDGGLGHADDDALIGALERNLYGTVSPAPGASRAVSGYLRAQAAALERVPGAALLAGQVRFDDPGLGDG